MQGIISIEKENPRIKDFNKKKDINKDIDNIKSFEDVKNILKQLVKE